MKLEIDSIQLNYGQHKVLLDVYFSASRGQITGLLGRNGSGKSSLLKIIFGSIKTEFRSVRIDGKPQRALGNEIKYLPQDCCFPKHLSLKTCAHLFHVNLDRFHHSFPEILTKKGHALGTLSFGERRIFEALVLLYSGGTALLLDEPFTGLSPLYVERLTEELTMLKNEKIIVVSDHQYQHVKSISDQIYLLSHAKTHVVQSDADLKYLGYINV